MMRETQNWWAENTLGHGACGPPAETFTRWEIKKHSQVGDHDYATVAQPLLVLSPRVAP